MKIISVFNNKGGVGKTTLAFHLANIMCDMGKKVLLIDADPQCNITIYSVSEELVQSIWEEEDGIIDAGITNDKNNVPDDILKKPRSIHFLLQPIIDGVDNYSSMPPPHSIRKNLSIIPGRLSLYMFEDTVSKRWSDLYRGDPLAIRTVTAIRNLAEQYGKKYKFDYIIIDTSPSLGVFNKTIISLADGFFIPAQPDIFSLYGIKNIGKSLSQWQNEFHIIYNLLGDEKRRRFPT
ncbi:ParA family protein, partial [Acidithiobacillus ferriphilus]|uniref:ParA family protein n=1 Tax=Acidithiobacillus ferriphilus TaxID=1689834 RepID=UPI002DB70982